MKILGRIGRVLVLVLGIEIRRTFSRSIRCSSRDSGGGSGSGSGSDR